MYTGHPNGELPANRGLRSGCRDSTSSGRLPAPTHVGLGPLPSPEATIYSLTFIKRFLCAEFPPLIGSTKLSKPRALVSDATPKREGGPSILRSRACLPFQFLLVPSAKQRVPAQCLRLARGKGLAPGSGPDSEAGGSHGRPRQSAGISCGTLRGK